MIGKLRKAVPERSGIRLFYHKMSAMAAAVFWRFPANNMIIIVVTGTAGKSTTVELVHHLIQNGGHKCGALSSIQFHIGEKIIENETLRTTLRPWNMQKYLRQMVNAKCTHCVIEVSSHAIDQNRIWGIPIDTAVLTNTSDNEHLDYHKTHSDYIKTKAKIFKNLYKGYRKANVQKQMILNADDPQFDLFYEFSANKKWTFSRHKQADVRSDDIVLTGKNISFTLKVPNHTVRIETPMVGSHNLENILTAIAVTMSVNIPIQKTEENLKSFAGAPGRLESIDAGQAFPVIVDHTYKPSALEPVLKTLKKIAKGRLVVVWGGTGNRPDFKLFQKNLHLCAEILDKYADEIVLTTDDPGPDDPRKIAKTVREKIDRVEGDRFFEIEDRYEAIRYAIYTAQANDMVLIAGRGTEKTQIIGKTAIHFDDREVAREVLSFALEKDLLEKK